jgi:hypothetical protein
MTMMRTPRRCDLLVRGADGWEIELEDNMRREDIYAVAVDSKTTLSIHPQRGQWEPQGDLVVLGLMEEAANRFWKNG